MAESERLRGSKSPTTNVVAPAFNTPATEPLVTVIVVAVPSVAPASSQITSVVK